MVFSSLIFLYVFLPVCMVLYFAMPDIRKKNLMLCALSLIFYAWGEPVWVVLLVFSALVDFVNGRLIGKYRGQWQAKAALISSVVINLSLIGTFKYLNFFFESVGFILGHSMPVLNITLPIGISFYTFQTLSYTIDVYRDKVHVQRSFLTFLLFVSLFPQLIAGPILRYSELESQLERRTFSLSGMAYGFMRFFIGLSKKVLIANFAGQTATAILDGNLASSSALEAWVGLLCFAIQIYFDFSGYSDMAIGLGKIFGFDYSENFSYPYISRSITEFWRRWHISLGQFFRDYVYIPLGGNRRMQLRNILIVWFLTGLWHGASWNFVLWGMYFGLLLLIEKYLLKSLLAKAGWLSLPYALFFSVLGWVLFYFTDLSRALMMLSALFGLNGGGDMTAAMIIFKNNILLIIFAAVACTPIGKYIEGMVIRLLGSKNTRERTLGGVAIIGFNAGAMFLCTAALVGASYNPFLYFRF